MRFVVITACPTGVAHSQMAAEALERVATDRGHEIEVEVQSAMGSENELSDGDIEAADAAIVAADVNVRTERFAGLPLVEVPVSTGVNDPGSVLDRAEAAATDGDGPERESTGDPDPDPGAGAGTGADSLVQRILDRF
ncbi:PTS fructose transporter subunit IIB [Halosimplex aquaticum]|uniref:PTS fructose transporter subunit IIB n=1 Tax=Halosimplex aquaticum TaxID=3026162 RepID=A0ABD5Y810_9EURY|nr:PTS fructose transporter subunit IIB [Halosimplex aquaticum]